MLKSFFLIVGLAVLGFLLLAVVPLPAPRSLERDRVVADRREPETEVIPSLAPLHESLPEAVIRQSEEIADGAEKQSPAVLPKPALPVPAVSASTTASSTAAAVSPVSAPPEPVLPPLREDELLRAVVKIECPSEDRRGVYIGAGFSMPRGVVVTAAHLLTDVASTTCKVIFPHDRAPAHYLFGTPENLDAVKKRYNEQGIDAAFLFLPALANYPEGKAVFPDGYPVISYPICTHSRAISDTVFHYGYPSNFSDNSYLAKNIGEVTAYADISGVREELSEDQRFLYKTPIFSYTVDQAVLHPYLVSRVPSFYGDSGGLAFDVTRQCILGVGHGGTIGGAAGENFSLLMMLGWEGVRGILP